MRQIVAALALLFTAVVLQAQNAPIVLGPYQYDGGGNIRAIGPNESFLYDRDARLVSAVMTPGTQTFAYDAFGNRIASDTTAGIVKCNDGADCTLKPAISKDTNRINAVTYDAAGNLKSIDGHDYTWDPLGMMTSQHYTQLVQYVYTADDERIAVYNGSRWEWSIRDVQNRVLRQLTSDDSASAAASSNWTWSADEIFRDGALLASDRPAVGRRHFHLDHLGTPRLITNDSGAIAAKYEYYAYGPLPDLGSPEIPTEELKFTGHQRDLAAGDVHVLDYMHARYYDGALGRFSSVDPEMELKEIVGNPQMWNRYAYVLNDPIKAIDPDGRDVYIVVTNQDVGDTVVRSKPGGVSVAGQKTETVGAYQVVMMNSSGTVNTDFEVSRDTNYADVSGRTRGDYTANKETPPGQYAGTVVNSSKLGPSVLVSDKKGGNTIKTPDGYTKSGALIHIGPGCSQGCFLLTGGKANRNAFMRALRTLRAQDSRANKGTDIHVIVQPRNGRECSGDTCVLK